jgi:hypothetical protein
MAYDKTDLNVYCNDLRVLANRIETALARRSPKTGTWDALTTKLSTVVIDAAQVLEELKGHINPEEGQE